MIDPGGMDDDIEVPEAVIDGIEKVRNRVGVGDVRRECRAAPALRLNLVDRRVGQVHFAGISHGDVKPVGGQPGGDNPPHAPRPASHQGGPGAACYCIAWSHGHLKRSYFFRQLREFSAPVADDVGPSRSVRGQTPMKMNRPVRL